MPEKPQIMAAMAERDTWPALRKGWRGKCPACGGGAMMQGYLAVRHSCPSCGEALHHQRADDGPAYLTILIVGHLMAPLLMRVFTTFHPQPGVMIAIFSTFTVVTSLYLLPRIKGAMVALQWAKRMHGFGMTAPSQDVV
jgi:uncharacterized protein (DUF983 family)